MTAKIKRAVRLRIREAEMLERIRPPFRECETFSVNNVLEGLLW